MFVEVFTFMCVKFFYNEGGVRGSVLVYGVWVCFCFFALGFKLVGVGVF